MSTSPINIYDFADSDIMHIYNSSSHINTMMINKRSTGLPILARALRARLSSIEREGYHQIIASALNHGYMDSYHVLLLLLFILVVVVVVIVVIVVVFCISKSRKELPKDVTDKDTDLSFKQPEILIDSDDGIKETVAKLTSRLMKKKNTSKNYTPVNDDNTIERSSFTHDSFGSNSRHKNKSFGSFTSNKSCRTSLSTVGSNSNESFSSYYIDYSGSIKTKCDTV